MDSSSPDRRSSLCTSHEQDHLEIKKDFSILKQLI